MHRIGDQPAEAVAAFNLGHAYKDLPVLRGLAQAEHWYRRSLELHDERDRLGRSKSIDQIGMVIHERFREAKDAGEPDEQILKYANEAADAYGLSLEWTPPNAVDKLAVSHAHLGDIHSETGNLDSALPHYRESIRYEEMQGNLYGAAQTRFNLALALIQTGRLSDAAEYARAALHNFETYGQDAAADIHKTQQLLAEIEQKMS